MEENKKLNQQLEEGQALENSAVEATPVVETTPVAETTPVVEATPVVEPESLVEGDSKISDESKNDGSGDINKRGLPFNIIIVIITIVLCVVFGIIVSRLLKVDKKVPDNKNDDSSPDSEIINNSNDINHDNEIASRYVYNEEGVIKTIYLKENSKKFYYLINNECISGNYGTYTISDNAFVMNSELYFDCNNCYHSEKSITNSSNAVEVFNFTFIEESNDLVSSSGDVYVYLDDEEIGNPFYNENIEYCDNVENAK